MLYKEWVIITKEWQEDGVVIRGGKRWGAMDSRISKRNEFRSMGIKDASMRHTYFVCPWNCVLI